MSADQLQRGTERAWRFAYSWPNIYRRLRHTAAPWHVALATNMGYRYYARRLHRFYTCDWMFDSLRPPRQSTQPVLAPAVSPSTVVQQTAQV